MSVLVPGPFVLVFTSQCCIVAYSSRLSSSSSVHHSHLHLCLHLLLLPACTHSLHPDCLTPTQPAIYLITRLLGCVTPPSYPSLAHTSGTWSRGCTTKYFSHHPWVMFATKSRADAHEYSSKIPIRAQLMAVGSVRLCAVLTVYYTTSYA